MRFPFARCCSCLAAVALLLAGCTRRVPVEEVKASNPAEIAAQADLAIAAGDWPWWRGPTRDNHAVGPPPPIKWTTDDNIVWKVSLPGRGHASPVIWGDKIFIATADEAKSTQSLICIDRATGTTQWNKVIHRGSLLSTHAKNSHASCTPVCDGQRVVTLFPVDEGLWATSVSLHGEIEWQKKVGPFVPKHGYGASPVAYKSLVIIAADHHGQGYLAALDRATGEVKWRTTRENIPSFGTPIIGRVAGKDQLLLSGQNRILSYDPASGEEIWSCTGSADSTANTMVWRDDLVFATGGWYQTGVFAIRASGVGQLPASDLVWESPYKVYVPSPLVVEDRLLAIRDEGIAVCYAAESGDKLWMKRLGGNFSASPTLIGDKVYLPNEEGVMFVFEAGRKLKLLAKNDLADGGFASPVIVGGRIYLRTLHHLWCIGE